MYSSYGINRLDRCTKPVPTAHTHLHLHTYTDTPRASNHACECSCTSVDGSGHFVVVRCECTYWIKTKYARCPESILLRIDWYQLNWLLSLYIYFCRELGVLQSSEIRTGRMSYYWVVISWHPPPRWAVAREKTQSRKRVKKLTGHSRWLMTHLDERSVRNSKNWRSTFLFLERRGFG
jgi:hypothetical protein